MPDLEDASDVEYLEEGNILIIRRALNTQVKEEVKGRYMTRTSPTPGISFKTRLIM